MSDTFTSSRVLRRLVLKPVLKLNITKLETLQYAGYSGAKIVSKENYISSVKLYMFHYFSIIVIPFNLRRRVESQVGFGHEVK